MTRRFYRARKKRPMETPVTRLWIQKVRELCADQGFTNNSRCTGLANRANSFGGPTIRPNNLYTFVQNTHPDGEALNAEKIERVAWALGYRLQLVPNDSVVVEKKRLLELESHLKKALTGLKQSLT